MRGWKSSGHLFLAPLIVFTVACACPSWVGSEDGVLQGTPSGRTEENQQTRTAPVANESPPSRSPEPSSEDGLTQAPEDPCLPPLYKDWRELSLHERHERPEDRFVGARIVIERETFRLSLHGIRPDGSAEEVYETYVALGDEESPTPGGSFIINHIYCYSDVVFFDLYHGKVPALYKSFFAPLLACDEQGNCQRYRELGLHGFDPSAYPEPGRIRPETYGAVSGGCIRLPDPCAFKTALIRLVGLGPLRKNDRGCYHWLNKTVEVRISDDNGMLFSILEEGLVHVRSGLRNLIGIFRP